MKYIKLKKHTEWFAVIEPNSTHILFQEECRERMIQEAIGGIHAPDYFFNLKMKAIDGLDYCKIATEKKQIVIVREKCSYMFLDEDDEIIEERISDGFPIDCPNDIDIVICENDEQTEHIWKKYLKKRFPNKKLFVINNFRYRDISDIRNIFSKVEYVTFYTTFMNCDWWEMVRDSVNENNKVIGYCTTKEGWDDALSIFDDVEIIDKENLIEK